MIQKNVKQLSVFVLPEQKERVEEKAKLDGRSTSNFCKKIILEAIKE